MKKILIALVVIILLSVGIFYSQILATVDFYQHQKDNADTFSEAAIDWQQIPFTSNRSSGMAGDSLSFQALQIPITFPADKQEGADSSFAFGGAQSIAINFSSASASFFRMYNFSEEDKRITCTFLSQTSSQDACMSNYNFYRAFLELNQSDIHIFTSIENKAIYNRIMTIRAEHIPSNTVSSFETNHVKGFIFTDNSGDYLVELFDSKDQQYHLELINLSQAEMAFVLSNTTHLK